MTQQTPSPPTPARFSTSLLATFQLLGWLLASEAFVRVLFVPHFLLHDQSDRWELVALAFGGVLGLALVVGFLHLLVRRVVQFGTSVALSLWLVLFALDFSARNLIGSPFHSRAILLGGAIVVGGAMVAAIAEVVQRRLGGMQERWAGHPLAFAWVVLLLSLPFLPLPDVSEVSEVSDVADVAVVADAADVADVESIADPLRGDVGVAAAGIGGADAPDVVLVSIDTGRADLTEGNDPVMKRLAELSTHGAVYSRAYAQENWTLPSHASIFTSLYPPVHGVEDLDSRLSPTTQTFAQSFQSAGYRSLALIDGDRKGFVGADRGFDRGFRHYVHYPDSRGVGEILLPYRWISDLLAFTDRGHSEDLVGNAVRWLGQEDERPALLFLHLYDVHASWGARWPLHRWPYMPRQPFLREKGIDTPPRDQLQIDGYSGAGYLREANERFEDGAPVETVVPAEERDLLRAMYNSSAAYVDTELSRLWEVLADRDRPFVLCVTSDHGEEFLEHGFLGHDQEYEECLRVPLIWIAPGRVAARQHAKVVELVDIAPTLLDLAGLQIPRGFQGESLVDDAEPGTNTSSEAGMGFATHTDSDTDDVGETFVGRDIAFAANEVDRLYAVKTQRYSYLVNGRTGSERLYDLTEDPGELNDLFSRGGHAGSVRALRSRPGGSELESSTVDVAAIDSLRTTLARWRADNFARREGGDKLVLDDAARERLRSLGYIK